MTEPGGRSGDGPSWSTERRHLEAIADFTDLVAASARSSRQRERLAKAAGLPVTGANLVALRLVDRFGPVAVTDVARRLGLDQSTASRQLRPLEEMGLISRTTDPSDRRLALLTTTPAGRDVLRRVREIQLNDFDVAMSDWPPEDRARLAELLDRFRAALVAARTDERGWSIRPDASVSAAPHTGHD